MTVEDDSAAYFLECAKRLSPVFGAIVDKFSRLSLDQLTERYANDLEWITSKEVCVNVCIVIIVFFTNCNPSLSVYNENNMLCDPPLLNGYCSY